MVVEEGRGKRIMNFPFFFLLQITVSISQRKCISIKEGILYAQF